MTPLSRQVSEIFVRDYMLQSLLPAAFFREEYPMLKFETIGLNLFLVEVPIGAETEFERLNAAGYALALPSVYGLNGRERIGASNISMFHDYPFGALRGEGTMIGLVDTGIDYTHQAFRKSDGATRIAAIWDQTIDGSPPHPYTFGSVYSEEVINTALRQTDPFSIVPTRDEVGHGTFLAGLAAGDDRADANSYRGGAPEAAIAVVKLRPAKAYINDYYLIENVDLAYLDFDILMGVNYLIQLAGELKRPIVICIGLGCNTGAHDGSTIVERYLNALTIRKNVILMISAGNEAGAYHHFRGRLNHVGHSQDIEINVSEEERSGIVISLWASLSDKLSVSLQSPIGQMIEKVQLTPQGKTVYNIGLENTRITVIYDYPNRQTGAEGIYIWLENPTPGVWRITVYGEEIVTGIYHVWLQRTGFSAEGTVFLKADTQTTVAIPGTEEFGITVGAYDAVNQSIYMSSGRGPTTSGVVKPDFLAPGVNVGGPRPGGGYTTYTGTSTATAIASAAGALLMQWAVLEGNLHDMNTRIARGIFIRGAAKQPGINYPNPIEGYGRLDLRKAIAGIG